MIAAHQRSGRARIWRHELRYLLERPITAGLLAGYALIASYISIADSFREAYFIAFDAVMLELVNFILPVFLFINLVLVLAPMFAGEIENHLEEIPATCLYGRRTRCITKLCATLSFIILLNLAYHLMTCVIGLATQPLEMWTQVVKSVDGAGLFSFSWNVSAHYLFAILSLLLGSIFTVVFTLLLSCNSQATMSVCAGMSLIGMLEYMFHRFGFVDVLRQYNLWQFLTPYRLASDAPFYSPAANTALVGGVFALLSLIALGDILKKGG